MKKKQMNKEKRKKKKKREEKKEKKKKLKRRLRQLRRNEVGNACEEEREGLRKIEKGKGKRKDYGHYEGIKKRKQPERGRERERENKRSRKFLKCKGYKKKNGREGMIK